MHLYWNSGFARSIRVLNNETHDIIYRWKDVEESRERKNSFNELFFYSDQFPL